MGLGRVGFFVVVVLGLGEVCLGEAAGTQPGEKDGVGVEERMWNELEGTRDFVEGLAKQEAEALEKVRGVEKAVGETGRVTKEQGETLQELARGQAAAATWAEGVWTWTAEAWRKVRGESPAGAEMEPVLAEVKAGLVDGGREALVEAGRALLRAAGGAGDAQAQDAALRALAEAVRQEELAAAALQGVMVRLDPGGVAATGWWSRRWLRREWATVAQDQRTVIGIIKNLAPRTSGQRFDELSPSLQRGLEDIGREEDRLAERVEVLIAGMEKGAGRLAGAAPALAQALGNAIQAAKDKQVSAQLSSAGQHFSRNALSAGGNAAGKALAGMLAMNFELGRAERWDLDLQARQVEEAQDYLDALWSVEEELKTQVAETGARTTKEAWAEMAQRQGKLRASVAKWEQRVAGLADGKPVVDHLGQAAAGMDKVQAGLRRMDAVATAAGLAEATGEIGPAHTEVRRLRRGAEERLWRARLEEILGRYELILKEQSRIKEVWVVAEAMKRRGPFDRDMALRVGDMARAQEEQFEALQAVSKDDEPGCVMEAMQATLGKDMETAAKRFRGAGAGPELMRAQERMVRELGELVEALRSEREWPREGWGWWRPGRLALFRPITEVKLVRAEQAAIRAETQDLARRLEEAKDEAERKAVRAEVRELGARQEWVRGMMEEWALAFGVRVGRD